MRYLLVILFFISSSFAYEFYAKLEPIESFQVKSSVSGKVIYSNDKIEGLKSNNTKVIEIDSYVDRIDLEQSNNKLKAINSMMKIEEKNYNRLLKVSSKSGFEKDNQKLKVINLKTSKADIMIKIANLKNSIKNKKLIEKSNYIYNIAVKKGDYVNPGTLLYESKDLSKGKLEIYIPIADVDKLKDKTFSLTCSFHHPHPPYLASKKYIEMFPPEEMILPENISDDMENSPYLRTKKGTSKSYSDPEKIKYFISEYYAMVKEVDDWVGEILDKLEELGLAENTLVVFTSDHGEMLGGHGLRGKFNFYEESSHVPMMIRFPGRIKEGIIVDSPVSNIDLFATILDYLEMPETPSDGISLRGLIEGTADKDTYVVTEWLSDLTTKPSHMVLKGGWKLLIPDSSAKTELNALYNLNDDPYELHNLLRTSDCKKYDDKVTELQSCFKEWQARTAQNTYNK